MRRLLFLSLLALNLMLAFALGQESIGRISILQQAILKCVGASITVDLTALDTSEFEQASIDNVAEETKALFSRDLSSFSPEAVSCISGFVSGVVSYSESFSLETSDDRRTIEYKSCRHPSHGIERYEETLIESFSSGWRGGGYNQPAWCNDAISIASRKHKVFSDNDGKIAIVRSSEDARWTGFLGRERQYNYFCELKIDRNPIYRLQSSSFCGAK